MIEKAKAAYAAVRDFLIYLVTPLAFLAGFIYYMFAKQRGLEDKISDLTRDQRQKNFEGKVIEDEIEVEKATSDYARLRDEYLKQHGESGQPVPADNSGSGPSDSGAGETDQGP